MKRRVEAQLRLEQALAAREAQLQNTEKQMRLVADRIVKRADKEGECHYVCEESLKKCLAWKVWVNNFPIKEFDGYLQDFWIGQLLPRAVHARFVILGTCGGRNITLHSRILWRDFARSTDLPSPCRQCPAGQHTGSCGWSARSRRIYLILRKKQVSSHPESPREASGLICVRRRKSIDALRDAAQASATFH